MTAQRSHRHLRQKVGLALNDAICPSGPIERRVEFTLGGHLVRQLDEGLTECFDEPNGREEMLALIVDPRLGEV